MDKRHSILIVSVTIFVLCFVAAASATTWSVDGSGGADFTGIQDAINNAKDGDTIIVHSGVYREKVVVNKSVTLKGNGNPVVDVSGWGSTIRLTANGIMLVGFTAKNSGFYNAGIEVASNNNTLTRNTVHNNLWSGIHLLPHSSNNSITGNNVDNNHWGGIRLDKSNNNYIIGNNVNNNHDDGIILYDSSNNTITRNIFENDGLFVLNSYQNTVEDNTVNGKPLVYLEDASDIEVTDAGQVILVNCNNITVENQDLSYTNVGVELWKTENSRISSNKVSNNHGDGIYLGSSGNNTITGNNVNNNSEGICLETSRNNNITANTVRSNWYYGIYLGYSDNNKINLNNFRNNPYNVKSYGSTNNTWNSTEEITYIHNGTTYESYLGNYWDDYEGTNPDAKEIDSTGIWDMPYSIDEDGDNYPLMMPFEKYNITTSHE